MGWGPILIKPGWAPEGFLPGGEERTDRPTFHNWQPSLPIVVVFSSIVHSEFFLYSLAGRRGIIMGAPSGNTYWRVGFVPSEHKPANSLRGGLLFPVDGPSPLFLRLVLRPNRKGVGPDCQFFLSGSDCEFSTFEICRKGWVGMCARDLDRGPSLHRPNESTILSGPDFLLNPTILPPMNHGINTAASLTQDMDTRQVDGRFKWRIAASSGELDLLNSINQTEWLNDWLITALVSLILQYSSPILHNPESLDQRKPIP